MQEYLSSLARRVRGFLRAEMPLVRIEHDDRAPAAEPGAATPGVAPPGAPEAALSATLDPAAAPPVVALPGEAPPVVAPPLPTVPLEPPCSFDPGRPIGLAVDGLVAVDDERVFLRGWAWDAERVVERFDLILPGGERLDLRPRIARFPKPDVSDLYRPAFGERADDDVGFYALLRPPRPAAGHRGYTIEMRPRDGEPLWIRLPEPVDDPFAGRHEVLRGLPETPYPDLEPLVEHLHPALERLQARCRETVAVDRIVGDGTPPSSPGCTLVVPVHRRLDLLEHQFAQWGDDPALAAAEVLYVLGDPALAGAFEETLFQLGRLYGIAARGVVPTRAAGYAAAINLGAGAARGRKLVLLHADVLPVEPGWLDALLGDPDGDPDAGVVGAKLLDEHRAIHSAGLVFSRDGRADGLWDCRHRFAGLSRRLPAAERAGEVPAASAACALVDRALFERLDGLADVYVAGDLEDADLALRCAEAGRENRYRPVELFHLAGTERARLPGWARNPWTELYNRWLLDRRWGERLPGVMDRHRAAGAV